MSVHFSLSDIDSEIPPKKGAAKTGGSNFEPFPTRFLSKKRKVEELYDLDNPASNLLIATDSIIEDYTDKVATIDALTATLKKNTLKLEKAKRKIGTLKAALAQRPAHAQEEGSDTHTTLIEEMKRDATIAVLESKIHMATEAAENGLDASLWDVKGWKNKLAKMKDDYSQNTYFIGLGDSKILIRKATKAPKIIKGETSNPKGDEDMMVADNAIDIEESSGEDGI